MIAPLPIRVALLILASIALCTPLSGEMIHVGMSQTGASQIYIPPQPTIRSAAIIFSGTVLKVEHLTPTGSFGITQITFRVENGIRGTQRGHNLLVREWAGLWNSGERYRIGEHVFLFLYPKSKLGLTSPVAGPQGRYEVDRSGQVLANGFGPRPRPIHISAFSAAIRRAVGE